MRRKILQDYANKVCEMLVGWRLAVNPDDIPRLIEIGSGDLQIDLIGSTSRLDGIEVAPFGIVAEVRAWLMERCDLDGVAVEDLHEVTVRLQFDASESRGKRRRRIRELEFRCDSAIRTDERTYAGSLQKSERWVGSAGSAPWVVTT